MSARTEERAQAGLDLLQTPMVRRFLQSRFYPLVFQVALVIGLVLLLLFAFLGLDRGSRNFATVVHWNLWWPLLPLLLLLFARAWCAICPVGAIAYWLQKAIGTLDRKPGRFLRDYGVVLMGLTFIGITWLDRTAAFTVSPRATGFFLLGILGAAVLVSLVYSRLAWCRYLCPIGAFTGLYAMNAALELRADPQRCLQCKTLDCFRGNARTDGCPTFEFARTMESNRNCSLCANCIKSCPHDALQLRVRWPGTELWGIRGLSLGESLFALALLGLVVIQTVDMTTGWGEYVKWTLEETPIKSYRGLFSLTFVASVTLPVLLYMAAATISSQVAGGRRDLHWAAFGYAYIPVVVAGHLGHNLAHLVGEGPRAARVAVEQLSFGLIPPATLSQVEPNSTWSLLALVLLAAGVALALVAAAKIASRHTGSVLPAALPHWTLIAMLGIFLGIIFALPMTPVHGH
ncbi:MAG: 4Fe-4S binding protein [Chloroflexi bacterium]|nr:4Fe-4S binding protein [Chloroflexota bacterium]